MKKLWKQILLYVFILSIGFAFGVLCVGIFSQKTSAKLTEQQEESTVFLGFEKVLKTAIEGFLRGEEINREFWIYNGFSGNLDKVESLMKEFFSNSSDSMVSSEWKKERIELLKKISGKGIITVDYYKEADGNENFIIYFKTNNIYKKKHLVIRSVRPYFVNFLPSYKYSQSFLEEE